MDYQQLQDEAENYIAQYFKLNFDSRFVYHNFTHTKEVLDAAQQIGNHYQLNVQDFFVLTIAAVFHDAGYFQDQLNHEAKGAELANRFLEEKGVNSNIRDAVTGIILSTKMPQKPNGQLENILCDADLFHLGLDDFREKAKLLHQELELVYNKQISKNDWRKKDIEFLENHHYQTDYCRLLLGEQKQKNLEKLKSRLKEADNGNDKTQKQELAADKLLGSKNSKPDKGIETMFRITSANNQRLSDMADNKAHLLITVNSIILSLIVSLLIRRLDDNKFLIVPTFMLLLISTSCIVISILSTRPSIPGGYFSDDDLQKKKVNLLFFGNFYKMPLQKYTEGMNNVMNDKAFLYNTLITDVYSQGVVLGRKYKLIRVAYNIFMFGLVTSIIAFVAASLIYGKL